MNARVAYEAHPVGVRHPAGDCGPCQIPGCQQCATVIVRWEISEYGETLAWYCDEHQPQVGR